MCTLDGLYQDRKTPPKRCTLHTPHSTLHTPPSTLHPPHSTLFCLYLFSVKNINEMSFCNKLKRFDSYIFATRCCRPLIFHTMNSVR